MPFPKDRLTAPLVLSVAFFLWFTLLSCPPASEARLEGGPSVSASEPTLPKADHVSPHTVRRWLSEGRKVFLIDVRKPKEYEAGHIEDALNIPYDQVERYADTFDREFPLVFYCISSSWRAPYSANLLKDLGFQNVYILEGGIVAWKAGGQTIRTSQKDQAPTIAPYPKDLRIALNHPEERRYDEPVVLTPETLKQFDGQDGRPAYVAVEGKIYDITQSRLWRGGTHDPSHATASAGRDLTSLIHKSPHGVKELEKFPVVGRLVEEEGE